MNMMKSNDTIALNDQAAGTNDNMIEGERALEGNNATKHSEEHSESPIEDSTFECVNFPVSLFFPHFSFFRLLFNF